MMSIYTTRFLFSSSSSSSMLFLLMVVFLSSPFMTNTFVNGEVENVAITWSVPGGDSLPPESVKVGDTVTFTWSGTHNVYIHPSQSCDQTEGIEVGTSSPTTYTFTEADAPPGVYFACHVASHCFQGQHVFFEVAHSDGHDHGNDPTASPADSGSSGSNRNGGAVLVASSLVGSTLVIIATMGLF